MLTSSMNRDLEGITHTASVNLPSTLTGVGRITIDLNDQVDLMLGSDVAKNDARRRVAAFCAT